jgi:hypothetical protein
MKHQVQYLKLELVQQNKLLQMTIIVWENNALILGISAKIQLNYTQVVDININPRNM